MAAQNDGDEKKNCDAATADSSGNNAEKPPAASQGNGVSPHLAADRQTIRIKARHIGNLILNRR